MNETYEFVAIGANMPTIELFTQCMYKAMFERKYKESSDDASTNDLKQFIWLYVKPHSSHF